MKVVVNQIIF